MVAQTTSRPSLSAGWHIPYLGRPFDARRWNCGTLVRTVLREHFGVEIPGDWNIYPGPDDIVDAAIQAEKKTARWIPIELNNEQPGDVCEFLQAGASLHVGVVVRRGVVLHVSETQHTQAQPIAVARRITRLAGIWRHPYLA
jgi:cell wall-associated NlpC family hydrolase